MDHALPVILMSYRRYNDRSRTQRNRNDPRKRISDKKYEEEAIILDIIPVEFNKRRDRYKDEEIIQAMGTKWYTLLEVIPEDANGLSHHDLIKLNKENRNNIKTIIGRISYDDLSPVAEKNLLTVLDTLLNDNERYFVNWLNKIGPISIRLHSLHLIKGIGPKSLGIILKERKSQPFISYMDFEERTKIKDIKELIKQRIIDEIKGEDIKHYLFTRPHGKKDKR